MSHVIIENLSKDYPVDRFATIVGHSGSGKTTLLSLVGGMVRPTAGRVLFNGTDIYQWDSDRLSEYRCEKIGFMFQSASLLPILTAKENLLLPVAFRSAPAHDGGIEQRARELLRQVGLGDKIDAYPSQLSGGQQRRVAIARAFMNGPELILADEPTGDLDEETEEEMMRFFLRMNEEQRTTFLMVTHNTTLAARASVRFRMDNGKLQTA
jgi:putative ABC transport system ATP-binding protein